MNRLRRNARPGAPKPRGETTSVPDTAASVDFTWALGVFIPNAEPDATYLCLAVLPFSNKLSTIGLRSRAVCLLSPDLPGDLIAMACSTTLIARDNWEREGNP